MYIATSATHYPNNRLSHATQAADELPVGVAFSALPRTTFGFKRHLQDTFEQIGPYFRPDSFNHKVEKPY